MRQKICKEKCTHCHSTEHTVYKNKNQCYCKNCGKYFKPGSARKEYSITTALVLNTILSLFYSKLTKFSNFRNFVKILKEKSVPTIHNVKIKYERVPDKENPKDTSELSIDGDLKESIILTRSGNGFIVTRGLDVRQKIKFNDFIINTSGPGNMTGDYYLDEEIQSGG
ncbi:unknown [Brachyspira sp. CAG:484]|nr:unknown [Brachyspira sp. CAG:484]